MLHYKFPSNQPANDQPTIPKITETSTPASSDRVPPASNYRGAVSGGNRAADRSAKPGPSFELISAHKKNHVIRSRALAYTLHPFCRGARRVAASGQQDGARDRQRASERPIQRGLRDIEWKRNRVSVRASAANSRWPDNIEYFSSER